MLDTFIKLLRDEKEVILNAPISIVVITIVVWTLLHFKFRHRIKDLNELIKIKDQRIEEFKRATESGSPDDAADQLEGLRERVLRMEGGPVPQEYLKVLGVEISKLNGQINIGSEMTDAGSGWVARKLCEVFRESDWKVSTYSMSGSYEGRRHWISLEFIEGVSRTQSERSVMAAFDLAGIEYEVSISAKQSESSSDWVTLYVAAPDPDM